MRRQALIVSGIIVVIAASLPALAGFEVPPGFVVQILEPTGGRIARPVGWFYSELHQGPTLRWIISREDPARGPYETGMSVQLFVGVEKGTGMTPRQWVADLIAKRKAAGRVIAECPPENQGFFTRVCLETEERLSGPAGGTKLYRVEYSLFWGNEADMACVIVVGTPAREWDRYRATFGVMRKVDVLDPARFPPGDGR